MKISRFDFPSVAHLLAATLFGLSVSACGSEPAAAAASGATASRSIAPITILIGSADCDNESQCHAIGIGSKPCGGPSGYLAWSSKSTDPAALRAAVERQARAQADENMARRLASNCMVTPEPTAACLPRAPDGRKTCQLTAVGSIRAD